MGGGNVSADRRRPCLQMFLLAGQSNMAGRGNVSEARVNTDERILVLSADGQWETPAQHPLHHDKPEKAGVGPGLSFAQSVIDFLPSKEQQIGLIPAAFGGS